MRRIKLMKLAAVAASMAIFATAAPARTATMYRVERTAHHASADTTPDQLERAIVVGAERSGWWPRVRKPGLVEAEKIVHGGAHTAVVEILFDDRTFLIRYVNSFNLNHDPKRCRASRGRRTVVCSEVIHPNYNAWVRALEDGVMRMTADAATLEPSTTTVTAAPNIVHSVADELIKLKRLQDEGILTQEEFETEKAKLLAR